MTLAVDLGVNPTNQSNVNLTFAQSSGIATGVVDISTLKESYKKEDSHNLSYKNLPTYIYSCGLEFQSEIHVQPIKMHNHMNNPMSNSGAAL